MNGPADADKTGRQGVGQQMKSSGFKAWAELHCIAVSPLLCDIGWANRAISATGEIFFENVLLVAETVVAN